MPRVHRKGRGGLGKRWIFFPGILFLPRAYREWRGGGLGNYQNFFPEIFLGGGVLEMREKNSWRIFTELFAQN